VEKACELDRADFIGVPAIATQLRLGQEIDRHRGVSENERLSKRWRRHRNRGKKGPYLSHLVVSSMKVAFTHVAEAKARQMPG
jgi:hypothetical protein